LAADDVVLRIRFVVAGHEPLAPGEFVDLFQCAEAFVQSAAEQELLALLEELGLTTDDRFEALRRIHRVRRRVPIPAAVESIHRGSWEVVLTLGGTAILWLLKEYVHPVSREVWDASDARGKLRGFIERRMFRRAKPAVEQAAVEQSRWGNLQVTGVESTPEHGGAHPVAPQLTVRLERRQVIEVTISDRELIEEFINRFNT
jgi:hypothetical protein